MGKLMLSAMLEGASGSAGDRVVARSRAGLTSRSKPTYKYPKNAAVQAGNGRLKAANAAWNEMSVQQAESWNRHAAGLPRKRAFDGSRYKTTGKNTLVAYVSKILQVDPEAEIPLDPPTGRFKIPDTELTMEAVPGALRVRSSLVVPEGTVVEVMVQALPSGKRKPGKFYKSTAFLTFTEAGERHDIPVQAGWCAVMAQFVEPATGRTAGKTPLGKVEVQQEPALEP